MAFRGLFDMGEAATGAIDWLSMTHSGRPAASIDPETLFDFQETRPQVRVGVNGAREILWPSNNAVWARTPEGCRDLVLLSGVEPNLRWRSFGETLSEIIRHTRCELVVTLGSTLAMAPHTRAFPVKASTIDPDLAARLNVSQPTYEGPTGLIGSLHQQLADGPPMLSLRVSVPHYVPGAPSPKATAALLYQLERLTGVETEHTALADDIRDWERRVHRALADDDDVRSYVEQLEAEADAQPVIDLSTENLDAEIEAFLRERNED
jgi:hypothetical protein